jgi:hypothetical protein
MNSLSTLGIAKLYAPTIPPIELVKSVICEPKDAFGISRIMSQTNTANPAIETCNCDRCLNAITK